MGGSYAEWKAEMLPLAAGLQAEHDNASWTREVETHRLTLVPSLWIGPKAPMWLESEEKSSTDRCVGILERLVDATYYRGGCRSNRSPGRLQRNGEFREAGVGRYDKLGSRAVGTEDAQRDHGALFETPELVGFG